MDRYGNLVFGVFESVWLMEEGRNFINLNQPQHNVMTDGERVTALTQETPDFTGYFPAILRLQHTIRSLPSELDEDWLGRFIKLLIYYVLI